MRKAFKHFFKFLSIFIILGGLSSTAVMAADSESTLKVYKNLGGNFELVGHDGHAVQLQDYQDQVVLLTFGYTHCPDVCPLGLANIAQVMKRLGNQEEKVQTIFVSFDVERDTPDRLKEYVTYFHPRFIGLTGSEEQIAETAMKYRAIYIKQESESAAGTLYAHTDYIYLIDQKGFLRALYRTDSPMEKMVNEIQQVLSEVKS